MLKEKIKRKISKEDFRLILWIGKGGGGEEAGRKGETMPHSSTYKQLGFIKTQETDRGFESLACHMLCLSPLLSCYRHWLTFIFLF